MDQDEVFVAPEEHDPEELERIVRHSARRRGEDEEVMLVQLPSDQGFMRGLRRATIVNTANTPQTDLGQQMDPFEWHFRKNSPDFRASLVQEAILDELNSRRKSRIGNGEMEQMTLIMSAHSTVRQPVRFSIEEIDDSEMKEVENKTLEGEVGKRKSTKPSAVSVNQHSSAKCNDNTSTEKLKEVGNKTVGVEEEKRQSIESTARLSRHSSVKFEDTKKEIISKSIDESEKMSETTLATEPNENKLHEENDSLPVLDTIMNTMVFDYSDELLDENPPTKEEKRSLVGNTRNEFTVMPAQYSFVDQQSPFKDDEIKPRPSSRVRVLIMLDEWDEDDGFNDGTGRKRKAHGDGRKGQYPDRHGDPGKDKSGRGARPGGGYGGYDERGQDGRPGNGSRRYGGGTRPGEGYGGDDERGWGGQGRPGDGSRKYGDGKRPGEGYSGDDERGWSSQLGDGTRPGKGYGGNDGRGRGGRPGDGTRPGKGYGGYDEKESRRGRPGDGSRKYGDGRRPGDGYDGDDDESSQRGRPGDRSRPGDGSKRYGDGKRPGEGYDGDDEKGSRRGRPGNGSRKYGDGRRPGEGYEGDDDKSSRRGRPGDGSKKYGQRPGEGFDVDDDKRGRPGSGRRTEGPDKGFDDGGRGGKGRRARPGGDIDSRKVRTLTMPKSATTLTTRRRYHLQITDHKMKEPYFNSCFNISKENNVDFNYEGPIKITPYYVGDKFT